VAVLVAAYCKKQNFKTKGTFCIVIKILTKAVYFGIFRGSNDV
jgi:hypothetical protein